MLLVKIFTKTCYSCSVKKIFFKFNIFRSEGSQELALSLRLSVPLIVQFL